MSPRDDLDDAQDASNMDDDKEEDNREEREDEELGSHVIVEDDKEVEDAEWTQDNFEELIQDKVFTEERRAIEQYMENKLKLPVVAQWRNPVLSTVKENVIIKSIVQFNPFTGIVFIVEPLFEFYGAKMTKKRRRTVVKDLKSTGYYVPASDLFGMKKKSLIGRVLDAHRQYLRRCTLVNETKAHLEISDLNTVRTECELKIPGVNNIQAPHPNMNKLRSNDDVNLRLIVNKYQSHGGRPPTKTKVSKALDSPDSNLRITFCCPMNSGCVNDLATMIRYVTLCCNFPFDAKLVTRYSFLQEQQIELSLSVLAVNYRCKQGVIFKATVTSAKIEPMEDKFKVERDVESDSENEDDEKPRKKRRVNEEDVQNIETFNGKEIKVNAHNLKINEEGDSTNVKVMSDYQLWFCHSLLVDERKSDDLWNSLRHYLQFIE
ncbi:ribosome-recycling factor [Acrasis kona]|uniref:Ribosome-recycling factor n=1 Tax=Acrasis kona TaxID=1008807 RepID=A0AAW2ZR70_9EUKA